MSGQGSSQEVSQETSQEEKQEASQEEKQDTFWKQITIIGMGMIGGSLAWGIKARRLAQTITAWDENPTSLQQALDAGVIDRAGESLADAVLSDTDTNSELVILAVPIQALVPVFQALDTIKATDILITDVSSVKSAVIAAASKVFGKVPAYLVPGHPIAGSERSGFAAADSNLFVQHRVILTPVDNTAPQAVDRVSSLWQELGAEVVEMTPAHHDVLLAQISHLPHLLAYALVDTLSVQGEELEVFQYAAGGFRDFSRIAASDPGMWRDIIRTNSTPVLEVLDRYLDEIRDIKHLLEQDDAEGLEALFSRAKSARDHFSSLSKEPNKE